KFSFALLLIPSHPTSFILIFHHLLHSFSFLLLFFFFNDPATTEIYTLSLHDALPIFDEVTIVGSRCGPFDRALSALSAGRNARRSEEHTSELQSRGHLVCRLLLEKKKNKNEHITLQC